MFFFCLFKKTKQTILRKVIGKYSAALKQFLQRSRQMFNFLFEEREIYNVTRISLKSTFDFGLGYIFFSMLHSL